MQQEPTQQVPPAQTNSSLLLSRDDIEDSDDALLVPSNMDTPNSSTPSRLHPSINFAGPNVDPEELLQFDTTDSSGGAKTTVHGSISEIGAQSGHNTSDMLSTSYDSVSLCSNISLTEAQERAISGTEVTSLLIYKITFVWSFLMNQSLEQVICILILYVNNQQSD